MEASAKPIVAAIHGTALGGGLEIGLACHHRIGLDAKGVLYGLPEVTLGLLPGGGGVVRVTRLLGIAELMSELKTRDRYRHRCNRGPEGRSCGLLVAPRLLQ